MTRRSKTILQSLINRFSQFKTTWKSNDLGHYHKILGQKSINQILFRIWSFVWLNDHPRSYNFTHMDKLSTRWIKQIEKLNELELEPSIARFNETTNMHDACSEPSNLDSDRFGTRPNIGSVLFDKVHSWLMTGRLSE